MAREHQDQRRFGELGHLADAPDALVVQLLGRGRADAPQPLDVERMEEGQLAVGRDHEQPVGLGHSARHLREELGPRHPDRDGQAHPLAYLSPQASGYLDGPPRDPLEAGDVEERLVDRELLDHRRGVLENLEHRLAGVDVGLPPSLHHDGLRA